MAGSRREQGNLDKSANSSSCEGLVWNQRAWTRNVCLATRRVPSGPGVTHLPGPRFSGVTSGITWIVNFRRIAVSRGEPSSSHLVEMDDVAWQVEAIAGTVT
jgi:hypothetical protein